LHRFIEEGVAETIRQLMRCCGAFAERDRDVFGAPCFRRDLLEDI